MKIIFAIVALAATTCAIPANAQDVRDRSEIVHYADLDLATDAGRTELDRRLRVAIKAACGTASDAHPGGKNEVRRCREATRAIAARQREIAMASAERRSATRYASER
ncbi:UrcA family protein [Sphingosinicella rhizophila]|uniref:UrcA family protein n=1 Tax=Sphingosinicella rhizophila TaxID=3050082 RepID=A0ABU3Q590_9SPHN|nr:UrcA family protein [Sphingosinicella sp. GR2756]MDT9598581.1 UrcA family protein [Sphingosinicella sp. GR2756]